jgi:hypothetical protein
MAARRMNGCLRLCAIACLAIWQAAASEHSGQVTFNGLPVPGATVTATRDGKTLSAITDERGVYSFADLADGTWAIDVEMTGFAPAKRDIAAAPNAPPAAWELKLLPLGRIQARMIQAPAALPAAKTAPAEAEDELSRQAADGFLINGSANNGAASPFAQARAFGNNRTGGKGLYTGGIGVILDNSALDARPFSLTGQDTPKAAYSRITGVAALGGPLRIPHLFKNGPNFFAGYQWTRNNNVSTQPGLMPDLAERNGILAGPVLDPLSGAPFPGSVIPPDRISPQARALLGLYPLPNFASDPRYNYQVAVVSPTHQDSFWSRFNKTVDSRNQLYGRFALQSTRGDNPNLFGFLDTTDLLGINTGANWSHRIGQQWVVNLGYQFSRLANRVTPYFENRENISGQAGISGNNQDLMNWGPPGLNFASGIAPLSDAQSSFDRNQTSGLSYAMLWHRGEHNVTFGADFRRQEFNYLSQQDARGTFTFTGGTSGSDFADFLLGIPDTSSIAFGNADKYFRESVYDAYMTDDWRISPQLTVNAGLRWEYGAPITELYGRLVNLDVAPGFAAVAPVVARDAAGALTGERYPDSLVRPDKHGLEPRIGIAWRPVSGSSLVVRAGYGVYYDTSVYQTIALQMAQQPPLSKTLSVQNSAANPLTLANGFTAPPSAASNTFAIDPNFRVGYAQNWRLSVQRDLPGALQMTAAYLGIKGTRAMQEFLPNTFPAGAANPCAACPTGFAYLTSNGNSTREAAQIQLRRRLHNGFTATLQYTFSKSIDDAAALGGQGPTIAQSPITQNSFSPGYVVSGGTGPAGLAMAQNWLDLRAERSLSTFDQRQLLSLQLQYTSGMGAKGGTFLTGWRGTLFKEWTFATQITAGTGLPQTPVFLAPVEGTGVTGTIRPEYTGAPLYAAPAGFFLNPAAYVAPPPGEWGNAGRNSITGPAQFTLNASLGRTFRLSDRLNLDLRADAINALNRVNFTTWNTVINNAQFGLPAAANAMRTVQLTLRARF